MPGGSSQTGGFVGGVGAPAYLSVSGYELCLDEYTPAGTSHSEYCLPQKRPFSCTENSWNQLKNVFKGDCPQSSVIGGKNCIPNYLKSKIPYSRYYKPLSNISPSWIEDAPKALKMLEKNKF